MKKNFSKYYSSDSEKELSERETPVKKPKKPVFDIITRDKWGAEEAKEGVRYFRKKPELVRVCTTGTTTCHDFMECCGLVHNIQERDFDEGIPDIKYNFLVSSEGLIFEGRSWKKIPQIRGQRYRSRCFLIAIIGEYIDVMPPIDALRSVGDLLNEAMNKKHLDRNFKMLPFQSNIKPVPDYLEPNDISFSEFEDLVSEHEMFTSI